MKPLDVHVEEIGRQRFAAVLPKLRTVVRDCSFMAIDTEMGGLSLQDCRPSMMDSIQERYEQFRTNAQQFPLVQFGLSCFTWNADAKHFDVECFQFPIFPRYSKIDTTELPDRRFLVQPRCLQYIRDHGFDLNNWIDNGITYLSHADQMRFESLLATSVTPDVLRKFDANVPALVTADTREFLTDMTKKIRKRFAGATLQPCSGSGRGKHARRDSRGRRNQHQQQQLHDSRRSSTSSKDDNVDVGDSNIEDAGDVNVDDVGDINVDDVGSSDSFTHSAAEMRAARKFLVASLEPDVRNSGSGSNKHRSDWPSAVFLTEPLAPFRRHVLLQHVQKLFPHVEAFDCKADNSGEDVQQNPWKRRVRFVATTSAKERHCLLAAYKQIVQQEIRERNLEHIGFTELMDVLAQARKPLVGHNLLLDVMQCFEKFHEPLPPRCSEFLHELDTWLCGSGSNGGSSGADSSAKHPAATASAALRGGIYDTKEMVTYAIETLDVFANNVPHSALETAYDALSKSPFHSADIRIKGPSSASTSCPSTSSTSPQRLKPRVQAHQAGYDAFMTGFVFLRVCSGLGVPNSALAALGGVSVTCASPADATTADSTDTIRTYIPPLDARLQRFRNVLHVSHFLPAHTLRVPGPFPDESETPSRACYVRLHLVRTAADGGRLKTFHIKQCIAHALGLGAATKLVHVHWEGKHWVYVALPTPALAEQLLRVRDRTAESAGSAADPMPSIGCVDIYRCADTTTSTTTSTYTLTDREHAVAVARTANDDDAELEAEKKQPKRRK